MKEGGSWWAGRSRREEEAAGVGEEEAPRPAAGRHLRHRRRLAAQSGRAATRGPLLLPQPQSQDWPPVSADLSTRAGFSGFVFASCLYPPLPGLHGDGWWRWARGALKFALLPRGPESLERRRAGDSRLEGPWELLNGRCPRCLLPPVFPPHFPPLSPPPSFPSDFLPNPSTLSLHLSLGVFPRFRSVLC